MKLPLRVALASALCAAVSPAAPALGQTTALAATSRPVVIYTKDSAPPAPRLEDLPLQGSVTKDDVTWTFDRPARVGRFVNGDFYVVGPVAVTKIDPPPLWGEEVKVVSDYETQKRVKKEELIRNGSLLSPVPELALTGFDSRSRNFTSRIQF